MTFRNLAGTVLVFALASVSNCQAQEDGGAKECTNVSPPSSRTLNISDRSTDLLAQLGPKEVVLTFDDGPHAWRTRKVLNVLDRHCLKATFLLTGRNAERHPKIVRDIAKRGHTVGSHTYAHKNLTELELAAALSEVELGHTKVAEALLPLSSPPQTHLFRFPFVASSAELRSAVSEAGFLILGVDADGADWTRNAPSDSTDLILQKLDESDQRGIILLHDPVRRAEERTSHLIEALVQQGYSFVHVVENDPS